MNPIEKAVMPLKEKAILRAEKEDKEIQKWKTQQIVNVSKLGTLFNQWPTRKVK